MENSNIEAAMEKAKGKPVRKPRTGSTENNPADKQVLVRLPDQERERWKLAAEKKGLSLSEFIRESVSKVVKELLDCPHPISMRKAYPYVGAPSTWSEFCLQCGARIK